MAEGREEQRDEHMAKAMRYVAGAEDALDRGDEGAATAFAGIAAAHAAIAAAIPPEPRELDLGLAGDWAEYEVERSAQAAQRAASRLRVLP